VTAQELVEMPQVVFHRRLVGPGFVQALLVERFAARGDSRADFGILVRGLALGRLLGGDEVALE
jgi:hypothetical protein